MNGNVIDSVDAVRIPLFRTVARDGMIPSM